MATSKKNTQDSGQQATPRSGGSLKLNSKFSGGGLIVQRGATMPMMLPVINRAIEETPVREGHVRAIPRFLSIMMDKGAPGLRVSVIGGPKSKVEYLAEMAVQANVVGQIADAFSDVELMKKVNDSLIRGNTRFKNGVFTIDFLTLHRAVQKAIGAPSSRTDPLWIVGRVVTELLGRAYEKMNVMVPFVGGAELEWRLDPVADSDALITAARVANVTEVFEAIQLGGAFDATKEFNPAVTEAMIGPLLSSAANKLMNSLRFEQYMRDTRTLTGMKLINPGFLPAHMQDNPDLDYLATNASFAVGALQHATDPISTPDFDLREAVSYTVMRLREMKRFESWSLERFASHYGVEQILAPSGYNAGVYVYRREELKVGAQVTRFMARGDVVIQQPAEVAEAYLSPYVEAVNQAFAGDVIQRSVAVAAQHVVVNQWQNNEDQAGGYMYGFNVSERELQYLALAHSSAITLGGLGSKLDDPHNPVIYYEVPDLKAFYEAKGLPIGSGMSTADPAEVLILLQVKANDPAPFPVKPQVILDDLRRTVLSRIPTDFDVDGNTYKGLLELDKPVRVELPMLDETPLIRHESLQDLIGLESIGTLHLTSELEHYRHLSSGFAALCAAYSELTSYGEVGRLHGRQVAVALYSLVSHMAKSGAFLPLLRTVLKRFAYDPAMEGKRQALRSHLQQDYVRHVAALNAAFMLLLKLGLLEFGVHEDMVKIFDSESVVDIAVTAEHWQTAMASRI